MPIHKYPVFFVALTLTLIFSTLGIIDPAAMADALQVGLHFAITRFGWLYLLAMFFFVAFSLYLAFSRFGEIRLGGDDAEPAFSQVSWFSMLFAAGMGIGLVFWGTAEPISHFAAPPLGLTPGTPEAARASLRFAFFHWGLHPWAAYCVVALALAFGHFNRGRSMHISSIFTPLIGDRVNGPIGRAIDVLAIVATIFGVATSLGFGTLQIASGLEHLFGLPVGMTTNTIIVGVAACLYLISSLTGVEKGIRLLSNTNLLIAAGLVSAVFLLGPTAFIMDSFTTTLGDYTNALISMSLRLTPFTKGEWVANWTLFYWAWWISWAPFVGTFIAQISRGRTLREFIAGVLLLPSLTGFLWFSVFGGTALSQSLFDGHNLVAVNKADVSMTLFAVLENLPAGSIMSVVAILLVGVFFVTSADSATYVLAVMSTGGQKAPPNWMKLIWGLLIAVLALVLLVSGGLKALQTVAILTALPFGMLMILMCVSLRKDLEADGVRRRKIREARERKLDQLLEDEKRPR